MILTHPYEAFKKVHIWAEVENTQNHLLSALPALLPLLPLLRTGREDTTPFVSCQEPPSCLASCLAAAPPRQPHHPRPPRQLACTPQRSRPSNPMSSSLGGCNNRPLKPFVFHQLAGYSSCCHAPPSRRARSSHGPLGPDRACVPPPALSCSCHGATAA